jgi:hypothetical protein
MNIPHSSIQINPKKTLTKTEIKQVIDKTLNGIKQIFSKNTIEEIAYESGFIKRSSKIRGFDFLVSLLVSSMDSSYSSLERISDIIAHLSLGTVVTAQAVMKRINNVDAPNFLKEVFAKVMSVRLLKLDEIPSSLLAFFKKVLLQDSSSVTLNEELQDYFKGSGGRASKACAKFDVIYDYKSKQYEKITLTDQSQSDQTLASKIEDLITENSLIIRDLGYLQVGSLTQIIDKKAFFLSRLRSDMSIYLNENDENPIDLGHYFSRECKSGVLDRDVFITNKKLRVRLVAYKAPDDVANKRKRDARATSAKQGRTLKDSTLRFFEFTVFITNVSKEMWKTEVIGTIYRVRWQIELIFKCWKTGAKIHYLKGTNPERIKCLIYAKLIFILILHQIYRLVEFMAYHQCKALVSMLKIFKWMKDSGRLLSIIKGSMNRKQRNLFMKSIATCMCMQKRKRKTTFEILCECEFFGFQGS